MKNRKTPKTPSSIKWPVSKPNLGISKKNAGALVQAQEANKLITRMNQIVAATQVPHDLSDKRTGDINEALKGPVLGAEEAAQQAGDFLNTNTSWDDINVMADQVQGLLATCGHCMAPLKNLELRRCIEQPYLLTRLVNSLTRDIPVMQKELSTVRESHAGRQGPATSAEDLVASFDIFAKYVNLFESINDTIVPTQIQISTGIDAAMLKLEKINPQLAKELRDQFTFQMNVVSNTLAKLTGAPVDENIPVLQPAPEGEEALVLAQPA